VVNVIIPVRIGELTRIGLMKQSPQPSVATLSTIAIAKAVDLIAAGLIGFIQAIAVFGLGVNGCRNPSRSDSEAPEWGNCRAIGSPGNPGALAPRDFVGAVVARLCAARSPRKSITRESLRLVR
jgi:hypothetical protein